MEDQTNFILDSFWYCLMCYSALFRIISIKSWMFRKRFHILATSCCTQISWWSRHCMPCGTCWKSFQNKIYFHGPLTRYVKLRVAHVPGMPGTFSPPLRVSDPDMHHGTYVPSCMPGSLINSFLWSRCGENAPGIPGACATRNFTYLQRGPFIAIPIVKITRWQGSRGASFIKVKLARYTRILHAYSYILHQSYIK